MRIQFQDINLDVIPDKSHEWLLETDLVANGYGVKASSIRSQKSRHAKELKENKHYTTVANCNGGEPTTYWTKKGIVRLGFFIKSDKAEQFRDWAEDLIVKTLDRPVDNLKGLEHHTKREVQIQNSKSVNSYLFENWDRETLIDYNRKNCRIVSGYSPSELKAMAKKSGFKSTQYSSGKEVLRNTKPGMAAQMSLNDDMVQQGVNLIEANTLSAPCLPLLNKMIELKMITI